ncbi:DUF2500 domain-containing protein [Herbinix luporum]|jgi:hypothetical protein|uniref:Putative membrane protein n=1 Tax=Herbinix luporum TaxID=1679721 RepID=A0A0K8J9I0_9FIRM|nr:DUF2500 domain-containing protein [Herbinix luporum]MDI9488371.1 DUF2500 domain-containing protein [Bacillota bacterium]CUH93908.1 putative membrane protein [Herbinix luporum]HHT56567.1 DUF2500 domain-containing protein [Herbinix luporum]
MVFFFRIFPYMFSLGFILVFGIIFVTIIRGIGQWNKNNHSPILTVEAKVVTKRMAVSDHIHHYGEGGMQQHYTSSSTYYVTFQVESGDRMEFVVPSREYGMLVEGDMGRLTFQGSRYKSFQRI